MPKIQAQMVLEILGRPAEHVKTALAQLVEKLGSEKGVKITDKTIHEPRAIEKSDLFTTFVEVSLEFDSMTNYFRVVFSYMPAHIEIISPESLTVKNTELTELGNSILTRLHQYDSVTKAVLADRGNLIAKLKEVAPHLFTSIKEAAPAQEVIQETEESKNNKEKK